ncbi:hypothetical protein [Streptomyces sp. NPDC050535]|uniref:hypothetical protein n=1 Tax=Streptomyces sp. NPDC050535 TaxID=3365626 RepID=UPI0037B6A9ED
MRKPLPETLQHFEALIAKQGLDRSSELNPETLARKMALPVDTVHLLIEGGSPPADTVNDRVCARIKTLADARAGTPRDKTLLVAEVAERLEVTVWWARQVVEGKKTPNVDALHHLSDFFGVEGDERFFTASAEDALTRILVARIQELEDPAEDPLDAVMREFGLVTADLRQYGSMTKPQFRNLLGGILSGLRAPSEESD